MSYLRRMPRYVRRLRRTRPGVYAYAVKAILEGELSKEQSRQTPRTAIITKLRLRHKLWAQRAARYLNPAATVPPAPTESSSQSGKMTVEEAREKFPCVGSPAAPIIVVP